MDHYIGQKTLPYVHLATAERSHEGVGGEGVLEDVAGDEEVMHPLATRGRGQELEDELSALAISNSRGLLGLAYFLAIGCVGH